MRVVLVEPSRVGRKILTRILEEQQHQVVSFDDGRKAFDYITHNLDVGVLLTSFEVQGMSGMELCWETRLLASHSRPIYIIAMSSNREIGKAVEALDAGADDFIRKPPVAEELHAKMRAARRLVMLQRELIRLAARDSLTGLLNRRAFFERSEALLADALGDIPFGLIMLDIDHFKAINDTYGHHAGDAVLQRVARIMSGVRGIVGRLGGEEFAIFLPAASDHESEKTAQQLRRTLADRALQFEGRDIAMSASFGVACWLGTAEDGVDDMLRRADEAMYKAKQGGRNRVVMADQDVQFHDQPSVA